MTYRLFTLLLILAAPTRGFRTSKLHPCRPPAAFTPAATVLLGVRRGAMEYASALVADAASELVDELEQLEVPISAAAASLATAAAHCEEDWELTTYALYEASQQLTASASAESEIAPDLADAAEALRAAAECSGCLSVGPPCASPSFEEAAVAFARAATRLGYSAAGARFSDVSEALREVGESFT